MCSNSTEKQLLMEFSPKYIEQITEIIQSTKKIDETKWYFEQKCHFGARCFGYNGTCGYVHKNIQETYITLNDPLPAYLCRYERPWENRRCSRFTCSYVHLFGHVEILKELYVESLDVIEEDSNRKWFIEQRCNNTNCNGIENICGYNHDNINESFIIPSKYIPPYLCPSEIPWVDSTLRCHKMICGYVHLRGHGNFIKRSFKKYIKNKTHAGNKLESNRK
jgi:hypothetical protein